MGYEPMSRKRELHLLKRLRDQTKYSKRRYRGMCLAIARASKTYEDLTFLHQFLVENEPKLFWVWGELFPVPFWFRGKDYYWWRPGARRPRIKWLEKKIKEHQLGKI